MSTFFKSLGISVLARLKFSLTLSSMKRAIVFKMGSDEAEGGTNQDAERKGFGCEADMQARADKGDRLSRVCCVSAQTRWTKNRHGSVCGAPLGQAFSRSEPNKGRRTKSDKCVAPLELPLTLHLFGLN